jgi:sodium/potassium-transporting ATPase subunit alpha
MLPSICSVTREAVLIALPVQELVVGDVVLIKAGDKIPADMRLFHATELKVDNSSLTGESEPQLRFPAPCTGPFLEATNLVFKGTTVTGGYGYGIVIRVGESTVIGQIMELTQGEKRRVSPLSAEIEKLISVIALIASFTAFCFFCISIRKGEGVR